MTATTHTPSRRTKVAPPRDPSGRPMLQRVATGIAGGIALLYALLYAGVLEIPGASAEELGTLGVAAVVFAVLAALLWWRRSRLLWAGTVAIQVVMGWMYLAIASERDPSFEVWGISIRVLSLGLVVALVALLVTDRRPRGADRTIDPEAAEPRVVDIHGPDRARR